MKVTDNRRDQQIFVNDCVNNWNKFDRSEKRNYPLKRININFTPISNDNQRSVQNSCEKEKEEKKKKKKGYRLRYTSSWSGSDARDRRLQGEKYLCARACHVLDRSGPRRHRSRHWSIDPEVLDKMLSSSWSRPARRPARGGPHALCRLSDLPSLSLLPVSLSPFDPSTPSLSFLSFLSGWFSALSQPGSAQRRPRLSLRFLLLVALLPPFRYHDLSPDLFFFLSLFFFFFSLSILFRARVSERRRGEK